MQEEPSIDILMATFNGARWLDTQLASIFAQSYTNWRLIIRDDASTDGTADVIRTWRDRYPHKILFLDEGNQSRLGLSGNFSALMHASTAAFIAVSDHDDIWYGDKLAKNVSAVVTLAGSKAADIPLLMHSDVTVVDGNLKQLYPSGMRFMGLAPRRKRTIGTLCLENSANGCTLIFNRKLLEMSYPIPSEIHVDWWLAFVACAFGKIQYLPEATIYWRRHDTNISEASSMKATIKGILNPLTHRKAFYIKLERNFIAAQTMLERFQETLSPSQKNTLHAFLSLPQIGFFARRIAILRYKLFFSSRLRSMGLLLLS